MSRTLRAPVPRRRGLEARLAARKQASLAQLLFAAARLYNERALARVQKRAPQARLAHTQLFPHIDLDGTRATDLAARVGITKQAVGQLVDELVALGLLERQDDPRDRRAQLIRFTDEGLAELVRGFDVLDGIERELGKLVGAATLARLRRDLATLTPALARLT
jgi:DNA-binding MarR family transcriptional regulator